VCPSGTVCREVCLCGTPPRGCSVVERHKEKLRLTAAGLSRRMAGCILDPARADVRKVKCDGAWGRSDVFTDVSDRAEDRAAFGTGGCVCAEGRTAFGTGGCVCAEERANVLPARAFLRRVGRLSAPGEASVPEVGRLFVSTRAFVRRADRFLYAGIHSGKDTGGFPYRLAPFRRGSDDFSNRCAPSCRHPGRFPNSRLHWCVRRYRCSDWSLFPPDGPGGLGVHSC
jgi:hypothetical protein